MVRKQIATLIKRPFCRELIFALAVFGLLLPSQWLAPARAVQDNTPPQLTAFAVSPTSFTTESADQTVTLSVTMTDDLAGVCIASDCGSYTGSATQMRMYSSDSSQYVDFTNFTRTSGDDKNGTYTAPAVFPRGIHTGTWHISVFNLVDKLGNSRGMQTADILAAVPGATGTTINNTAADSDTTAPTLTAFAVSPTSFTTESADQTLTATMTITDNQAGVCIGTDCGTYAGTSPTQFTFRPSDGIGPDVNFHNLSRTSGTDKNGTYTATAVFPHYIKKGSWSISTFLLGDKLGNTTTMNTASINANVPGATGTTLTNTATHDDTTAPQVTAFSLSPTEINTTNSDQTLTLNVTLTDDLAGVCLPADCGTFYTGGGTQLRLAPLIGTQFRDVTNLTRTSGTALNGTYTGTVVIPAHSKEGFWQVQLFTLTDKLGNTQGITGTQLSSVPGASGIIITNTATANSVTVDRDWTLTSSIGSVTFPAGTVVTRKDSGSFAFYQMIAQNFQVDSLPSEDRSGDSDVVGTMRTGIPGLNLAFSQPVTVAINVDSSFNGHQLRIQSLGEGADRWSEESTCTVSGGVCSFTVNHATYFLASKSLLPSSLPNTGGHGF